MCVCAVDLLPHCSCPLTMFLFAGFEPIVKEVPLLCRIPRYVRVRVRVRAADSPFSRHLLGKGRGKVLMKRVQMQHIVTATPLPSDSCSSANPSLVLCSVTPCLHSKPFTLHPSPLIGYSDLGSLSSPSHHHTRPVTAPFAMAL